VKRRDVLRRGQTRFLLWLGFGGLLILMAVLGISAVSFLYQIELRQDKIRNDYVERDRKLEKLRSSIYLSGTWARDFLLDLNEHTAASHREQFLAERGRIESLIADYERLPGPSERAAFEQLRREVRAYLTTIEPILGWSAEERRERGYLFMENEVLPRRMLAVGLTDRIQELSERQLEASSEEASGLFATFRARLVALLIFTIAAGLALAGFALWRILRLERESEKRFEESQHAREELKHLSAELVAAQENERRRISRELHDEVGQVLSAIMIGLGNLRSAIRQNDIDESLKQLQLVQDMTQRNASVVRNISLLLRPTMLDDLGLIPALKWLAREISRTTSLRVEVEADNAPEEMPEEHRTCVFRTVQEAVHNAARHSGATQARVRVEMSEGSRVRVSIQDDGRGFNPSEETGLGILGMQERVTRLGGSLRLDSAPGRGSIVWFDLPLPESIGSHQETRPLRTA
jgi:signal transduction histidine kinase